MLCWGCAVAHCSPHARASLPGASCAASSFCSGIGHACSINQTFPNLQEHFYLEPNCSIVIPKEHDEYEAFASTQVRTTPSAS